MQSANFNDDINEQPFIIVREDLIIEISQAFVDMTEYSIEELLNKNLEQALEILRVGPHNNFENVDNKLNYFLFSKSLDVRFVNIEVIKKRNKQIYLFREKAHSRISDTNQFLDRLITENQTAVGIFTAAELILLKANELLLSDYPEPYNKKEVLYGKSIKDVIPNFRGGVIEEAFNDIISNNKPHYYKEERWGVFNEPRYWDCSLIPVAVDGKVEYIVVMSNDITEHVLNKEYIIKQSEIIEHRNKQLEAIFESIDDSIYIFDSDENCCMANKAAKECFRNTVEDGTYKYFDSNGMEVSVENATVSKLFDGVIVKNSVFTMRNEKYTKHISVNGRPIYDINGNIKFVVLCCRDITSSIEAQQTIERQKDELEAIIESIGDILLIIDKDGNVEKQSSTNISSCYKSIDSSIEFFNFNNKRLNAEDRPIHKVIKKGQKVKSFGMKLTDNINEKYIIMNGTPIFNSYGQVKLGVFAILDITELMEKEREIKKQKVLLENIIENTSNGVFIFDKDGKQLMINEEARRLAFPDNPFYILEDIYTTNELFNGDDNFDMEAKPLSKRAINGEVVNSEKVIVKQSNKDMVLEFKSSPIYDSNGNVDIIVTYTHDITELVKQNKLIKQQKELLESIIENMSDAMIVYDKDNNVILQNEATKKILYNSDNFKKYGDILKTTKVLDIWGNEILEQDLPTIRSFKGEKVTNLMITLKRPDKILYCTISSSPIYDEYGSISNVVVCIHDITDLIEKEKKIKEQKEQLEAILNSMQEAILVFDKDDKYIITNNVSIKMLKTKVESVGDGYRGRIFYNINGRKVLPEEMPAYYVKKKRYVKGKVVYYEEAGKREYIMVNAVPIIDSKGEFLYGIISCRNITEFMGNQQKLELAQQLLLKAEREKNETLEKALEMKDEFLSLISHEFRTPINVISTAIQALNFIYGDGLSDKVKEYLGTIRQNTFRQLRLVNNLLDITRANAGRIKVNKKNIDIVFLTKAITESVYDYAAQKGVIVNFKSSLKKQVIGIDDEKYERIILNLISNAIKFTSEGKSILVNLRSVKGNICIEVKDNGIGIPQDKIDIIFEKFGQVDSSLSRQAEGTGIGLSLVKMFVSALGGSISVKSKVGKGSTFTVMFPNEKVTGENSENKIIDFMDNHLVETINVEFSDIYL